MKAFPSSIDILNAVSGIGVSCLQKGIRYGRSPRHRCLPDRRAGAAPLIVFFDGGGWEERERGNYSFVGSTLAARGFTTVSPDYRVFSEVRFPDFIEDATTTLRWAVENVAEFGGDRGWIMVIGHSASAHIAATLAFDRKWVDNVNLDARIDRGMIGFGPERGLAATQPINFVEAGSPPAFLATGRNDRTVEPSNTIRLAERIGAFGGEAEIKLYDRVDQRMLIGALARPSLFLAPVLDDVVGFALKHSHPHALLDWMAAQARTV